jgi:hypothetical protein
MVASLASLCAAQDNRCRYCGVMFAAKGGFRPTREHKKPAWSGGGSSRLNLIASCHSCNALKGPLDHHTFMAVMSDLGAIKRWSAAYSMALEKRKRDGAPKPYSLEEVHKEARARVGRKMIKPGNGWSGGHRKATAMGYPKEMTFEEAIEIVRLVEPDAGCDVDEHADYEAKYRRRNGYGTGRPDKIQAAKLRQEERMAKIEFDRRLINGIYVDFADPNAPFLQRLK